MSTLTSKVRRKTRSGEEEARGHCAHSLHGSGEGRAVATGEDVMEPDASVAAMKLDGMELSREFAVSQPHPKSASGPTGESGRYRRQGASEQE